ncbi:hypothetical protein NIES4101_81380 [Calothrix sp. NIES-4101]|nr:hypothetical protein NIES4101_81380 [Calothrix sp. NIES-4101]
MNSLTSSEAEMLKLSEVEALTPNSPNPYSVI